MKMAGSRCSLLQAQIEEQPGPGRGDARSVSPTLRNPYTGEPMEYDSRAGRSDSTCLHTRLPSAGAGRPMQRRLGDKAP